MSGAKPLAPIVTAFFDERTFTVSYVVQDRSSKACAVVDSVLDFDPASGRTSIASPAPTSSAISPAEVPAADR